MQLELIIITHQINLFRVHCFNNYEKNKDKNCPDLELTYYIECSEKIENLDLRENDIGRRGDPPIICQQEPQQEINKKPSRNSTSSEDTTTALLQTTETPSTTEQLTDQPEDSGNSTRTFHISLSYQIFVTFLKKLSQTDFSQILGAPAAVNISGPP